MSYYGIRMKRRGSKNEAVQLPTEAELEILNILWALGPSTVRDVHTASGKDSGYTTILKQMQVMTEKGLLIRSERFRSHVYEAGLPKEKTRARLANVLLRRAFEGSARELMLGALSARPVSAEELAGIRRMIDAFAQE